MITQSEALLQHKNFVPIQRDVRICVKLTATEANQVVARLLTIFSALATLRSAHQLQNVNAHCQFRIAAIRGGTLPAELTAAAVWAVIDDVCRPVAEVA